MRNHNELVTSGFANTNSCTSLGSQNKCTFTNKYKQSDGLSKLLLWTAYFNL